MSTQILTASQRKLLADIAAREADGWSALDVDGRRFTVARSLADAGLITYRSDGTGCFGTSPYGPNGGKRAVRVVWVCRLTDAGREAIAL